MMVRSRVTEVGTSGPEKQTTIDARPKTRPRKRCGVQKQNDIEYISTDSINYKGKPHKCFQRDR